MESTWLSATATSAAICTSAKSRLEAAIGPSNSSLRVKVLHASCRGRWTTKLPLVENRTPATGGGAALLSQRENEGGGGGGRTSISSRLLVLCAQSSQPPNTPREAEHMSAQRTAPAACPVGVSASRKNTSHPVSCNLKTSASRYCFSQHCAEHSHTAPSFPKDEKADPESLRM